MWRQNQEFHIGFSQFDESNGCVGFKVFNLGYLFAVQEAVNVVKINVGQWTINRTM